MKLRAKTIAADTQMSLVSKEKRNDEGGTMNAEREPFSCLKKETFFLLTPPL